MSKEIIVIVKNKLMSIDTVIPILIELKERYNVSSIVVVNDKLAHKGINDNVVIRDAVNYVGREMYTEPNVSNKLIRKLFKISFLFFLFFKLLQGVKVLHFGIINVFPFSIIGKAFEKQIFFLQNSSFKHSYGKFDKVIGQNPHIVIPIGKNIVAFNDGMKCLDVVRDNQKVYMFGSTRTRGCWLKYIDKRSDKYFEKYHSNVDLSNGCIVLILAFFGRSNQMRLPYESLKNLLSNTVVTLDKIKGDLPVLIKPHVFTDLHIVKEVINSLNEFHLTYLHPSVLAKKARVFICNTYSTTMSDAKSLGVKTVEYSDYNKSVLELSKGKSIGYEYIDEFINNDKDKFEKVMKSILLNRESECKQFYYENMDSDADKLLSKLAS
jgi:hypothetical protein